MFSGNSKPKSLSLNTVSISSSSTSSSSSYDKSTLLLLSLPPHLSFLIVRPPTLHDATEEARKLFKLPKDAELHLTMSYEMGEGKGTRKVALTSKSWDVVVLGRARKEGTLELEVVQDDERVEASEKGTGKRKTEGVVQKETDAPKAKRSIFDKPRAPSPFLPLRQPHLPSPTPFSSPPKIGEYDLIFEATSGRFTLRCQLEQTLWTVLEPFCKERGWKEEDLRLVAKGTIVRPCDYVRDVVKKFHNSMYPRHITVLKYVR